jgi:site-specific DNA-methyltransferase (adenine-specific)
MNKIELIKGCCLEKMKDIEDKSVDLILVDLPYEITKHKWDLIIPFKPLWEQYNRIIKPNKAIIIFGREPFTSKLICSNISNYKHKWIWNKKQSGSFMNAKFLPLQIDEDIVVFTSNGEKVNYYPIMRTGKMRKRGGAKETNKSIGINGLTSLYENKSDEYYPTNILEFVNKRSKKYHPTEKSIPLLEYLIKTYSKEGDIVLDNTFGSCSTGVACLNTNRQFIGIEKDLNYFNIGVNRIKENMKDNYELIVR